MKIFKYILVFCLVDYTINVDLQASDSVITLFVKEKIEPIKKVKLKNSRHISPALKQPSFIKAVGRDRSWLNQPGVDGIHAVYLGYIAISDQNGQISFPRQQQSDTVHILVTPQIEPELMMSPALVANWITKKNIPAEFYKIERKHNKEVKTYYFDVKKLKVPEEIPHGTITIFADPEHIHVPVGISLNTYSTNLILPELQASKVAIAKNSLYTLSIKQYFEQVVKENKKDTLNIAAMIINQ